MGLEGLDDAFQDEFQVKFWKLRQNEWEPYKLQYSPLNIRLGDLTDPLYFDFIQYAQYALLSREMPNGRQIFEVSGIALCHPCSLVRSCQVLLLRSRPQSPAATISVQHKKTGVQVPPR